MPILVADARAIVPGSYSNIVVYGSAFIGDGGGGCYVWSSVATNVDDGATWLKPNSITHPAPGRWQRVWMIELPASTSEPGIVQLGANGDTTTGYAVQCSDTRLHPAISLDGTPDYLTVTGQNMTRGPVDMAGDVSGTLALGSIARLAIVTQSATTRTGVTAAELGNYVRWTSNSAKTFTIPNSIAAAGDVWQGFNAATTTNATNGRLTLAQGAGVTLRGVLTFARWKMYTVYFNTPSLADVVGGA